MSVLRGQRHDVPRTDFRLREDQKTFLGVLTEKVRVAYTKQAAERLLKVTPPLALYNSEWFTWPPSSSVP